jgi:cell division protein FtsN
MKNEETGEFEVVLGNRQLLSGFFVVVILFAVFFVMGYIVGHNTTAPPAKVTAAVEQPSVSPPEARPQAAAPAAPVAADRNAGAAPASDQRAAGAAAQSPAEQPAPAAESKTEAQAAETKAGAPTAAGETYLQVVSVAQHDAEVVARTLKDQGFPSSLSPGPNGRTRVLVGPYSDVGALGKAKADLENLGFHPIVKK